MSITHASHTPNNALLPRAVHTGETADPELELGEVVDLPAEIVPNVDSIISVAMGPSWAALLLEGGGLALVPVRRKEEDSDKWKMDPKSARALHDI